MKSPSARMTELLRNAGSQKFEVAIAARQELAKALTLPLKKGVLKGDIISDIYEKIKFEPGQVVEFPLDLLSPGSEGVHTAYTIPATGRIPERQVEGDYCSVRTYEVGSSIDLALKYVREARWDVVSRALQVLEGSFVRKNNIDGWRVILAAGVGRNLLVSDSAGTSGYFTKRLVALMKTIMMRNAGGNSTSVDRGKLTRLYLSPEALEDIRSWTLTEVDDATRREIFVNETNGLMKIFGVELRELVELGETQEFQNYFVNPLGGDLNGLKELVVGLDLEKNDSFVMPVKHEVEIVEDPNFHRQRRVSFYGTGEHGFACLTALRVLLGCF